MIKFLKRIKYHSLRFKTDVTVGSIIIGFMSLIMGFSFPDDPDFIANYVDMITTAGLDAVLTTLNTDAPGWLFWISLMMGTYLYYTFAIVGVRIGARAFPTRNEDGLELITASNPQSQRRLYVESYLSGLLSLGVLMSVSYFFLSIYSILNGGADILGRLGFVHLYYYLTGTFLLSLASTVSLLRFDKKSGDKYGYLYLVFAFLLELSSSSEEVSEVVLNLSVSRYLDPMSSLFSEEWNWDAFLTVLGVVILLFFISLWWIKQPEYIERVSPAKSKQRVTFLPQYSPEGRLGSKYPVFFEELRTDRSLFFIWTGLVLFLVFYIVYLYDVLYGDDPAALAETLRSFDMPMFDAFTHGHELRFDYIGFMGFEFYGIFWMYYGLFLLFPSIGASSRDYKRGQQDVIWANAVTPRQIILARTLAIQLQFFILFTSTHALLFLLQTVMGIDVDVDRQLLTYLIGVFYFIGLGILLQGISMSFRLDRGRKIALWFFMGSLIILLTGFLVAELEFVRYLSVLYYYDAVGLVFGEMKVIDGMLRAFGFTLFSVVVYTIGLSRFSRSNLS